MWNKLFLLLSSLQVGVLQIDCNYLLSTVSTVRLFNILFNILPPGSLATFTLFEEKEAEGGARDGGQVQHSLSLRQLGGGGPPLVTR